MPKQDPGSGGPARVVNCPTCRSPTPYDAGNRWRPFCSERCRQGDLGAWASESYRVPAAAPPDDSATPKDSSGLAH